MTRYGKNTVIKIYFISLVIIAISIFLTLIYIKLLLLATGLFLLIFTSYFFRDPKRTLPEKITEKDIISPADGKIVGIKKIINKYTDLFNDDELMQLSIFLSPLNVHINRYPISGKINHYFYFEGKYFAAFKDKASEVNEQTEIGIVKNNNQLVMKQIAGFLARRIVAELHPDDYVTVGEKFGMIKFGSRVDLIFKCNTEIFVKLNDVVKAGETVLAKFPD